MRILGLIGGVTWHSTVKYYRRINEILSQRQSVYTSFEGALWNLDFAKVLDFQRRKDWAGLTAHIAQVGQKLKSSGCEALALCSNTIHKVAPALQAELNIPVLHVADAVKKHANTNGVKKIGLLGTRFTMREPFYKDALLPLEAVVPSTADGNEVDRIIFEELALGKVLPSSKEKYLSVCSELQKNGAEAVLLGCTEIGLLLQNGDHSLPLYDSVELHCEFLCDFICGKT
jgi:aspartate racemase